MTEEIKNCKTCYSNDDGFCELVAYHCYLHKDRPTPDCDENFSGWQKKVIVLSMWEVTMLSLVGWITLAGNSMSKSVKKISPKSSNTELTNNTLED